MAGLKIAIFSLNQWALDFTGNTERIKKSIILAKESQAGYRAGPELEVCGYSLEDAFYEQDTVYHSWLCLLDILEFSKSFNMIIDIGMPVYNSTLYNCRVLLYKGRILCIRAKTSLAREGIYREQRHFTPWKQDSGLTALKLPSFVSEKLQQDFVPFGAGFILDLNGINKCDTFRIGWEICQELWDVKNVSAGLYQNFGCHLVVNGSASYWELRKLNIVLDMVKGISLRGGACYAFSNSIGCDGQRYVFYGRSCIYDRGNLIAITSTTENIFEEVQMITHTVFANDIDEYRAQMGFKLTRLNSQEGVWNLSKPPKDVSQINNIYNRLYFDEALPIINNSQQYPLARLELRFEQEIFQYVSLWLWDYLRRSRMKGFMMPLSGGLDSSTVATLVYCVSKNIHLNLASKQVQDYFKNVHSIRVEDIYKELSNPEDVCRRILKCTYLSTMYSSNETAERAKLLANAIGAEFANVSIQNTYSNFKSLLNGNNESEEVSLLDQNLQARLRMTATYYLSGGNRIVLATGNVDEGIMGYLTKYDCSSADINPIGGMCKDDLKSFLKYCCTSLFKDKQSLVNILKDIIEAPPSAELTGAEQRDEDEIGVTYDEISVLGRVRRGAFGSCGPLGAFETVWRNRFKEPFSTKIRCLANPDAKQTAVQLSELIKRFYQRYANNRHKLTVLTPALHAETYSPDDNRFDHRHFLYAPWTEQFRCIDLFVQKIQDGEC